tara:strand:+ start:2905 stop:3183 length:279 start_codon:yes stop_codon:yes gene_type:complete
VICAGLEKLVVVAANASATDTDREAVTAGWQKPGCDRRPHERLHADVRLEQISQGVHVDLLDHFVELRNVREAAVGCPLSMQVGTSASISIL